MKVLLTSTLVLWFFGVLFFVNRAKSLHCEVQSSIASPSIASGDLPIISFDHYSHRPDTSAAFHLLRDSLLKRFKADERLTIIAHYTAIEADLDRNIGLKRANAIRTLFESYEGFDRIEIDSRLSERVSIPTIFAITPRHLLQNAIDTPIPPMMNEIVSGDPVNDVIAEPSVKVEKEIETEELVSAEVDTKSEPILKKETDADYVIYFKDNSSKMINASEVQKYLDKLSARVKQSKEKIEVTGYDDNSRDVTESLDLSNRRTYRVRKAFTDKYVRRKLVKVKSLGQTSPVASNNTAEGRNENRRVEIRILK